MSLSKIKKSDLLGFGDSVVTEYKGWTVIVEGQVERYAFSLTLFTDTNSDCGVYIPVSSYSDTIAEVKEEIKSAIEELCYTAKEASEWNVKLGNACRTYEELVDKIETFEKEAS